MKIMLYGYDKTKMNGIARYSNDLYNGLLINKNVDNVDYNEIKKIEIETANGKKHFGYISYNIFKQFQHANVYDIIHSLSALYSHKHSNVATVHDVVNIVNGVISPNSRLVRHMHNTLQFSNMEIIVPIQHVRNDIMYFFNLSGDNIHVVNMGIENIENKILNIKNPYTDNKIHLFVFGGLEDSRRKISKILDTLKHSEYEIYIAGYGSNIEVQLYAKYPNIHLLGYLSDYEVWNYMAYSDLLVYNSLGEGFGYIPLEAMRFNLNTVINDVNSFHDVYEDKVFYYEDNLIESIEFALDHKKNNLKEWVYRKYSMNRMIENTLKVYEGALCHS
jgi:hypothetical protein